MLGMMVLLFTPGTSTTVAATAAENTSFVEGHKFALQYAGSLSRRNLLYSAWAVHIEYFRA